MCAVPHTPRSWRYKVISAIFRRTRTITVLAGWPRDALEGISNEKTSREVSILRCTIARRSRLRTWCDCQRRRCAATRDPHLRQEDRHAGGGGAAKSVVDSAEFGIACCADQGFRVAVQVLYPGRSRQG